MDLDNNFTALIIAIFVISLLVGLAVYYNVPQFKNIHLSSENTSEARADRSSLSSQVDINLAGRI